MKKNDGILNKLEYLGLNLDKIPNKIKDFEPLEYRPSKFNDEHTYKVYKYVDVNDIEILLTKSNRLSPVAEKYKKAMPLYTYLDSTNEENLERHTKFLSMVSNMKIDEIERLEGEQKLLNDSIPFKVKFQKDYLWQIYYSEYTNKYFMLVTTEDLDHSAFFYVLKKQLKSKKKEKIFVPICYMEYAREYLTRMQITDIENYLWLFTKEWPLVYEVYNKKNELSLHIVGKAAIYDDIQSDYKIELKNNEDALKFYKLVKALFIMQTEIAHHFTFQASIDKKGSIEFNINGKKIIYEILPSFIKEEYLKAEDKKIKLIDDKAGLEKELNDLKKTSDKLEKEYLEKEKQISTYLEYKKTFFGRVKYFFKYKKVNLTKNAEHEEKHQDVKVVRLTKYDEIKKNYTLEELIEIYKQIDKEEIKEKNIKLDIKAMKHRIINLESKVKNATLYIEEIDKHKKSIFEFWKFSNKDKLAELPEGETKEEQGEKLKKVFEYNSDFEDLGINLDKKQREVLTKQELDSIFLTSTDILEDINVRLEGKLIESDRLEELKEKVLALKDEIDKDNFDIFSGISHDNKLNNLANQKHREAKKEIFSILPITKYTSLSEYNEMLNDVLKNLESAIQKINIGIEIPVYQCIEKDKIEGEYNVFNIQASNEMKKITQMNPDKLCLHKIYLNEDTNLLAYTNGVFFENTNKTLPLGMNVEEAVLLDINKLNIKEMDKNKISIVCFEDPKNEMSKVKVKQIKIKEYIITK